MCDFHFNGDYILTEEQQDSILQIAMAVDNQLEEGTFYRYDGSKAPQRLFCKTMMAMNKLYTKADINIMSFRGLNSQFAKKGTNRYSIFKYRGGANCKHYWREIEIRMDEDGLPVEYDRGIVDDSKVERLNFNKEDMDNLHELIFDGDNIDGVYGVSLVLDPANEMEAIFLSKEKLEQWRLSNEEKRIVISPVLIPNQKILRKSVGKDKQPGYVFMSENTIEKLQQNFWKNQYNKNSTLEHSEPIEGVYFYESWIVQDPENDKAKALGYEVPKGTWMMAMKIDNPEIWDNYIKTGLIKGFSIDALLRAEKINNNLEVKFKKMDKKTISEIVATSIQKVAMASELQKFDIADDLSVYATELVLNNIVTDVDGNPLSNIDFTFEGFKYETDEMGAIKSVEEVEAVEEDLVLDLEAILSELEVKDAEKEAVAFGSILANDESLTIYFDGSMITLGGEVYKDEAKTLLEVGTYVLESGVTIIVGEDGTVSEIIEAPVEDVAMADEETLDKLAEKEALVLELEAKVAELEAKIMGLEEKNTKLEADIVLKETEVVAMSKELPASLGIVHSPVINVTMSKEETALEAIKRVRNSK